MWADTTSDNIGSLDLHVGRMVDVVNSKFVLNIIYLIENHRSLFNKTKW